MAKVNLDRAYLFAGKIYGPGETDVPDDVLKSDALTPEFRDALEGKATEGAEPNPQDSSSGEPKTKHSGKSK